MSDSYSFECDLDRDRPETERAALTVHDDGEHIVFNFSDRAEDGGREVYLRPDMAANLAHLVGSLTDADADDTPEGTSRLTGWIAALLLVALVLNIALPLGALVFG